MNMKMPCLHLTKIGMIGLLAAGLSAISAGQTVEMHVPAALVAGGQASIPTTGSGKATFYLLGPGVSRKSEVNLGDEIRLESQETQNAGAYQAILCADNCQSATFYVSAAEPSGLYFLVHPSRVPVGQSDAVSGVAIPFDQFRNLILSPATVQFQLTAGTAPLLSRPVKTQAGIAWFRTTSGRSAGALQVVASLGSVVARRVVQQVASDPCNLKIEGQRTKTGITVETEPVRDCSGNPVPDGTIVTFTATEQGGKSTVDAPIKQGIARAQISGQGAALVSVASGVVMGKELHIGAQIESRPGGQP
jgi:hypothetical protein